MRGTDHQEQHQLELSNLQKVTDLCPPDARLVRVVDSFVSTTYGGCCLLAINPLARIDVEHLLAKPTPAFPYGMKEVITWALDMAAALRALHRSAKLYHGDLCPRNVLIGGDGHAYLTDYGISVYNHPYGQSKDGGDITLKESVSVAPEMLAGGLRGQDFDAGADMWGWGVVVDGLLSRSLARWVNLYVREDRETHTLMS